MQNDFIASESVIGENPLDSPELTNVNKTSTNDTELTPEPNKCLLLADALNHGASYADIIDGEHGEPFLNQTLIVDFGDCKCGDWGKSIIRISNAAMLTVYYKIWVLSADGGLGTLAGLLLFGWMICCPFCFQNVIGDNKPRGSEENPHYRHNEEGEWVQYRESE